MTKPSPNDSLNPSKRQVNSRLKRLTGLKRKKVNKLREIEKRQRRKFNKRLTTSTMPGENLLNGRMSLDQGASKLASKVDRRTKMMQMKLTKIKI